MACKYFISDYDRENPVTKKKPSILNKRRPLMTLAALCFFTLAIATWVAIYPHQSSTNPTTSASAIYPSDINSDNKVDVSDLSILIGKCGTTDATSDINKDGAVNVFDLSILISKWTG